MEFISKRYKFVYQKDEYMTKKFMKCAADFSDIFDDKVCFAAVGNDHFLVIEYDGEQDENKLIEKFKIAASEVLNNPPDFDTMVLDNGLGIVITARWLISVVKKGRFSSETRSIPIGVALEYRRAALKACEKLNIIAIAVPRFYRQ